MDQHTTARLVWPPPERLRGHTGISQHNCIHLKDNKPADHPDHYSKQYKISHALLFQPQTNPYEMPNPRDRA